jgi:hypothetical protein
MATRTRYLALSDLAPGMVLAQPLTQVEHEVVTYTLPAGHVLTDENLHQLASHHAVGALVLQEIDRSDAQHLAHIQRQSARLQMIFRHADLTVPQTQALVAVLLAHRSA